MSANAQASYIETRLIEQLGFYHPNVTLEINNVKSDPVPGETARVFYTIQGGKGVRTNLGVKKVDRFVDTLQLDVLVSEDEGNGDRDIVAGFLADIFNELEETLDDGSRLRFKVPSDPVEMGVKNGRSRCVISISYWRDEPMRERAI